MNNASIIILSIDPGYDRCGWAVGIKEKGEYKNLDFGLIQTKKTQTIFERFAQIMAFLLKLIEEYKPHHLAIENLYFSKNTTSAMRVAEVRGLIFGLAIANNIEIFEYDPVTIKLAVTGYGKADKASVTKLTLSQLKLTNLQTNQKKIIDDAVDALAIGLTHSTSHRN